MIGSFNNDRNNYRCTYAAEYADANRIAHPRSVYVREDHILEQLDPWLARAFSPSQLTATVHAMAEAQHDDADQQAIKAARETLATRATRLDRYRAALDSSADPTVASRWIADVQAEQVTAEAKLRRLSGRQTMSPDEIRHIVETLGNITAVLRDADPADKALIYRELGLNLTYRPTAENVLRMTSQCLARVGQPKPPPGPGEQRSTGRALERLHLLGDRGLGIAQGPCCRRI